MRMSNLVSGWLVGLVLPGVALAQGAATAEERERLLLARIAALEARLAALEARLGNGERAVVCASPSAAPSAAVPTAAPAGAMVNFFFDGYTAWNANRPANRTNLLRGYDGVAGGFGLNQTGLVVERAASAEDGRRWGFRLDLMAGQATDTLQGSRQNESRPEVYRHLFQAYGTYIVPVGRGVTVDFGKWASALGPEGNYTKDQINYSRSYFFNYLPFYHMGFRVSYPLSRKWKVSYWLVNGANQTEDFNGYKSQLGQIVLQPTRNLSWTVNYYSGREQRDEAGRRAAPRGRLHLIDTYAFWNVTDRLMVGGEYDFAVNREESGGAPQRLTGGAAYLRYQMTRRTYFGQRYAWLRDSAGLFSGRTQNLQDVTATLGFRPVEGFETRFEFRRDASNRLFFPRGTAGRLSRHQDTLTLGLLWWFGGKTGNW